MAHENKQEQPKFGPRYGLGEHTPALKGIALELGTKDASSVRLDVGDSADPYVAQALRGEMNKAGFKNDDASGPDAYIFVHNSEMAPQAAIRQIMETPKMLEVVESRREAMQRKEDERNAGIEAANDIVWKESQEKSQQDAVALDAAKAALQEIPNE